MPAIRVPRVVYLLTGLCLVLGSAWIDQPDLGRSVAVQPAAFDVTDADPAVVARVAPAAVFGDSTSIPCAAGTTDLGVHDGYHGGIKVPVRLCAVNNLISTRGEGVPSSPYYIKGANGHAVVNSRVSGAVQTMVRDMKAAGLAVRSFSSYRSMQHQRDLCAADVNCKAHNYHYLAAPGTSNHQMGLAIDFTMPMAKTPGASCAAPAGSPNNTVWKWLKVHAAHYGLEQYMAEPWHWEAAGANSC